MVDRTLATFRIDKETWKEFKQWASNRGSNASTELNQFILRSLGRIDNNLDSNLDNKNNRIDKDIDKRIEKYLDNNLDTRIEAIVKKYLDEHIDKHTDIDTNPAQCIDKDQKTNLDSNIDSYLDKTQSIDNHIDKDPMGEDEDITERLTEEKGLSRKELAELLGVRAEYLTHWKSGKNIPKENNNNYQAYQNFCKYQWKKKKGTNQTKYYLRVE